MKINRIMKINRMLSLALAICLVAALAASCTEGGSAATASKADSASAVSLTAEDVYGSGVSEETITALQNSGTITIGTSDASIGKGQYSDDLKAEMEFYKKYFGLTIKYRYASFTTDLTRFLVNYANGDANDMTYLSYSSWPKVGIRQVVYSIDELKALGVVGLDHPEITRYEDVASRFTIGGKKYSPGIRYTSPSLCAYNVDLFEQYSVKDPGAYYKEGNWNLDTYMQCCKEISRTLADGTKIYGSYWRDHTYYLVADDARMVSWNDKETRLVLNMTDTATVKALNVFRDAYLNGYSPSPEQGGTTLFKSGLMGTLIHDANNFAQVCKDYTFHWEIVPTPLGSNNVSGNIPGECSGNGVVNSTKNPQGVINYFIANSLWKSYYYNQPYGIYYAESFKGVYNDAQLKMVCESADHIGLDLYMGVGNLSTVQWDFWNAIKAGKRTVKEVFDTYEPVWQAEVDAENEYLAKLYH